MTLLFGVMRSKRVLFSGLFEAFCMGFNRLLYGILRMDTMIRQKVCSSLGTKQLNNVTLCMKGVFWIINNRKYGTN